MVNGPLWYTTFQQANTPGRPMASMAPQQAGVFVTPNQQQQSPVTPIPRANPYLSSLAQTMMAQGARTTPVASPLEGLARALTGVAGGYFAGQANEAEQARQAAIGERIGALTGLDPEQVEGLGPELALQTAEVRAAQQPKATETWRPLTPSEAQQYGVPQGEVWQISSRGKLREPGGATTTIQLPGEPREDFTTAQSKADVKRYEGWVEAAESARTQMGEIREAQRLLDQGLQTGVVTDMTSGLGRIMTAFGLDPQDYGLQDASSVEQFRAISNRLTLDLTEKLKGALSNKELDFIRDGTIGVGMTPETNRQIMAMLEKGARQAQLRLDAADLWIDEYGDLRTKNEDGRTFFGEWRKWLNDNEAIPEAAEAEESESEPEAVQAGVGGDSQGGSFLGEEFTDGSGTTWRRDPKTGDYVEVK